MGLPATIRSYLHRHQITFDVLPHRPTATLLQAAQACDLPLQRLVRAVVLMDDHGLVMAVLPADHVLDFDALRGELARNLEPVAAPNLAALFDDCERGSCPPLGAAYGLDVIVDSALADADTIAFEPGSHDCLVQLAGEDFQKLMQQGHRAGISRPMEVLADQHEAGINHLVEKFAPARVRDGMDEFHDLPAMPATAHLALQLLNDANADAEDLARIVEQDPSMAAQVMRYANSPLYGFSGKIKDIKSAIARVLGFDFVMNLVLGISVGRSLRVPLDGPLGLDAFWRHSVYSARLVEQLALAMPRAKRPNRGTAYLAGLLQNLGILVLGETFQPEFFLLNRYLLSNPDHALGELERQLFGTTHSRIGSWLMEAWGMPEELTLAVRHHHDERYRGEHARYAQLILVANCLLNNHGFCDAETATPPPNSLQFLGLEADQAQTIAEQLLNERNDLDQLAVRLSA